MNMKTISLLTIAAFAALTNAQNANDIPYGPLPTKEAADSGMGNGFQGQAVSYDIATAKVQVEDNSVQTLPKGYFETSEGRFLPGNNLPSRNAEPENVKNVEPPVKSGDTVGTSKVFGADGRTKINPANSYPWSAQTKLLMRFNSGWYMGSGTLISSNEVITAGHCIHDKNDGGWASQVIVIPGKAGASEPFGRFNATRLMSWTAWTGSKDSDHDMGVVRLGTHIGNSTGWLGLGAYGSLAGTTGNIAGYPGDRDGGEFLYYMAGTITYQTGNRYYYKIDTAGGQSGSGVYRIVNNNRYVFAAHSGWNYISWLDPFTWVFDEYNRATRVTSAKFTDIVNFINGG
jgi:V8-like Glu-specific endopeptidase